MSARTTVNLLIDVVRDFGYIKTMMVALPVTMLVLAASRFFYKKKDWRKEAPSDKEGEGNNLF